MANLSRRLLLQAMPFIGASAALPVAANAAPAPQDRVELINYHVAELLRLIQAAAGPCDGCSFHIGIHPWDRDTPQLRADRYWKVNETLHGKAFPVDRLREFDPITGLNTDHREMPDLTNWRPGNV
ncbi:MAG: hypothetical protein ACOH2N_04635 [Devosia sp.]